MAGVLAQGEVLCPFVSDTIASISHRGDKEESVDSGVYATRSFLVLTSKRGTNCKVMMLKYLATKGCCQRFTIFGGVEQFLLASQKLMCWDLRRC